MKKAKKAKAKENYFYKSKLVFILLTSLIIILSTGFTYNN
jgi:hypothetical protein